MTEDEFHKNDIAALGRGWKCMLSAWLLSIVTVFTFGILDGLYQARIFCPIPFWSFWFFVLAVALLFLVAMIIALKSMARKQGGFALFMTTLIVSIAGFLVGLPDYDDP